MIRPALKKRKVVKLSIVALVSILVFQRFLNPLSQWTTVGLSLKPRGADIPRGGTTPKLPNTAAKVIILTYMRSGSTLLGELFNTDPRAFYWFEPIRGVYGGLYENVAREPKTPDGHMEIVNRYMSQFEKDKMLSFVMDLYGCDTDNWLDEFLAWLVFLTLSSLRKVSQCAHRQNVTNCFQKTFLVGESIDDNAFPDLLQAYWLLKEKGVPFTNYSAEEALLLRASLGGNSTLERSTIDKLRFIISCFKNTSSKVRPCLESEGVQRACEKAKIRAIKTIRMQMDFVGLLFDFDPNVKVVHLLRDPRAVENSRYKLDWLRPRYSIALDAKRLCNAILRDLAVKQSLERKFPGRIMTVRYEDLVADTNKTIKAMYAFLGTRWTKEAADAFFASTTRDSSNPLEPRRANPKAVAEAWKAELNETQRQSIDAHCGRVYDLLGYPG